MTLSSDVFVNAGPERLAVAGGRLSRLLLDRTVLIAERISGTLHFGTIKGR